MFMSGAIARRTFMGSIAPENRTIARQGQARSFVGMVCVSIKTQGLLAFATR